MELITIILYSLLILIAALVVFVALSYIVSSIKKKNDKAKLVAQSTYQPIAPQYNTPMVDNIIIRKEVDSYHDNQMYTQPQIIEEEYHQPRPKIKRVRRKPSVRKEYKRYSVINNNQVPEGRVSVSNSKNYNTLDLKDYFGNYEDDDEGIYYNIKIGA